jgi:hypothetical protein
MTVYRDHDEDAEWDDEDDEARGGDDSDEEATVPCPSCRREIFEDSPRCPYCERYISEEDHAGQGKPLWIIATALICLGIAIWWALAG